MFSCLTPTPFWKPIIASYRSPRLRLRKRCRNISTQHLRLTKVESRSLYPILQHRSVDITTGKSIDASQWRTASLLSHRLSPSMGSHLWEPLSISEIPASGVRQSVKRWTCSRQSATFLLNTNPSLLMQSSVLSSRDNRSGDWRAS